LLEYQESCRAQQLFATATPLQILDSNQKRRRIIWRSLSAGTQNITRTGGEFSLSWDGGEKRKGQKTAPMLKLEIQKCQSSQEVLTFRLVGESGNLAAESAQKSGAKRQESKR